MGNNLNLLIIPYNTKFLDKLKNERQVYKSEGLLTFSN